MSLYTVTTGNTVLAADINQLVNTLQRPSGSTETGHYNLSGAAYAANAIISCYIASQSRNATPVSVTIDTADEAPTGTLRPPGTSYLTQGGFQIFSSPTAASTGCGCAGNYTIQY